MAREGGCLVSPDMHPMVALRGSDRNPGPTPVLLFWAVLARAAGDSSHEVNRAPARLAHVMLLRGMCNTFRVAM